MAVLLDENLMSVYLGNKHLDFGGCKWEEYYATSGILRATFNVTDASNPTHLYFYNTGSMEGAPIVTGLNLFKSIRVDGTEYSVSELDSNSGTMSLSAGEHTVEYELKDPATIGEGALAYCSVATNVEIPDSVISIGNAAFAGCTNLTSITLMPVTPPTIGDSVFVDCSSDLIIYVNDSDGTVYPVAEGWSVYAYRMAPIGGEPFFPVIPVQPVQ